MRRLSPVTLSSVSFAALAMLATPAAAYAQIQEDETSVTGEEGTPDADEAIAQSGDATGVAEQSNVEQRDEAIVVTGSRIRRSEFNSPDPITIISPELGLQAGQSQTAELLTNSPIAAGSTQITSAISTNYVTNGGEGAQTVSLRGLGAERTLVLLNGRRAGPAGVRGGVTSFDLNVLPISIVRSIEILKTGASSIYGSDAIAGVVNILTKKETDGLEIRGNVNAPFLGGGETYSASATWGRDFGNGHFLVSADYFRQNDLRRRDRSFLDCSEEFLKFESGARADIVDTRTGLPACNGVLHNSILTNNDFTGVDADGFPTFEPGLLAPNGEQLFVTQFAVGNELNGVCAPLNGIAPGVVAPSYAYGCNFDGPSTGVLNQYSDIERNTDIFSDLERYTFYADGAYEVAPGVELFTELLYNKRRTNTDGLAQVATFQFTGVSDLPGFFCAPTDFNCSPTDAGDPFNDEFEGNFLLRPLVLTGADSGTDIDYYRGVVGARGDFGNLLQNWNWDVYGQYSRSDGEYYQDITLADSVFTQDFRTASCEGLVTPVTGRPCLDIDWTDPRVLRGEFTPAERAFLFARDVGNTIFEQKTGEASVSGTLINLPAGELGVALGGQIRRDEINDVPGEQSQAGNAFNLTSAGITTGKTTTKEVFGEVNIPLIHNTPFVQRFTLTGAARYTAVDAERGDGVSDSFSDTTWKAGFDWEVNDWLRFRGSWGTSFRAPALFELFLENQTGFLAQQDIDVCINTANRLEQGLITQEIFDNCAAVGIPDDFQGATGGATIISGGGIGNLDPETSVAKTVSVVLTPSPFWEGMRANLAIDYFDIEVEDQITTLGGANIVTACYTSDFFPDDPLCDQITRAAAGTPDEFNITQVLDTYININRQKNRGIDVTAQFEQDVEDVGTFGLLAQMTWQLEDKVALFEGTELNINGEAGEPKWVGNFDVTYNRGAWTAYYGLDVIGGTSNYDDLIEEQGTECRTSIFRPGAPPEQARVPFCPDVRLSPTFYHSASITREIGENFQLTFGVANLFNTRPPRASTVFNGGIATLGQVPVFASQYDYLGRRFFASVRGSF